MCERYKGQLTQKELTWVLLLPKSTRYYKASNKKRGAKPSEVTTLGDGSSVSNKEVVNTLVEEVFSQEFNRYGYRLCNEELKALGYIINHKKTYRLMKEHGLLLEKVGIGKIKRQWVQFRKIVVAYPYQHLCMDIKYVHIHGMKRNAYLLAIMDIATRYVLGWSLRFSMRYPDVILCLHGALRGNQSEGIMLRTDNGSQFISHGLNKYCQQMNITHEFTHVATPEENAYVESLFSCVEKEVILEYEFDSLHHAREVFKRYFLYHNTKRRRHALGRRSPQDYWNTFFHFSSVKPPQAESGDLSRAVKPLVLPLTKTELEATFA